MKQIFQALQSLCVALSNVFKNASVWTMNGIRWTVLLLLRSAIGGGLQGEAKI